MTTPAISGIDNKTSPSREATHRFQSVHLGNFKAFGRTQRIPIRPLTLIFGPNSAGKSSFIHGLLYAHEAHNSHSFNSLNVTRPRLGGDSVDLGGFGQFVYRGVRADDDANEADIRHGVEWGVDLSTADLPSRLQELLAPCRNVRLSVSIDCVHMDPCWSVTQRSTTGNDFRHDDLFPGIASYEITADSDLLVRATGGISAIRENGADKKWELRIDHLDANHPILSADHKPMPSSHTADAPHPDDLCEAKESQRKFELLKNGNVVLQQGSFLPNGISPETFGAFAGLEIPALRRLDVLIRGLAEYVGNTLQRLRYLGPLRSYPSRQLAFSEDHDRNWFAGGGYAWDRVRRNSGIREQVNDWLGAKWMKTRYRLDSRDLVSLEDIEREFLQMWEEYEANEDYKPSGAQLADRCRNYSAIKDDLVLMDVVRNVVVSHRDIGIGISQVLPVLVSAFAADNETIAIEQPELHLHPALQAELGDVFIKAALCGKQNTFLLETHSEHLILRIMRRIREVAEGTLPEELPCIRAQDVSVLFVEPRESGSGIRVLELDDEGEFLDPWPGGFFEEGFRERFGK